MSTLFGKNQHKDKRRKREKTPDEPKKRDVIIANNPETSVTSTSYSSPFTSLGLSPLLSQTCESLGFRTPTIVQTTVIPAILRGDSHILALSATGSGKTAAYVLPILQTLISNPYGIYAMILTPTRELAKQVQEQVSVLGSRYKVTATLVTGGSDQVRQSCELSRLPHFCIATPGRLAELLRGADPPRMKNVRYLVLDEADRLLTADSGFERDVAEVILSVKGGGTNNKCQTLLFSATMTQSLEYVQKMALQKSDMKMEKFIIREPDCVVQPKNSKGEEGESVLSDIPQIPAGLVHEYIFMPSRVRDSYLIATIRTLIAYGGKTEPTTSKKAKHGNKWTTNTSEKRKKRATDEEEHQLQESQKAQSAIIFVSTCERTLLLSAILEELQISSISLHSMLSQNRRMASLAKFKSQHCRILICTDLASRGLDIPNVDLVINSELPRKAVDYIHRVGRTARAGRRGRAISLIGESDVNLVHECEKMSGREMNKCEDVEEDVAVKMLSVVMKATRLARQKLMDLGMDDMVKKFKERKRRDRMERERLGKILG